MYNVGWRVDTWRIVNLNSGLTTFKFDDEGRT